jgi:methionine sulfoxide reductase heme-binding subunit
LRIARRHEPDLEPRRLVRDPASGLVAYALVTAVVCLGLVLSSRPSWRRWPRFALEDVHRFAGILAGVFVALHVLTIAINSYVPFSVVQLLVPFTAGYRPFWTALGDVGFELLLAVALSTRWRRRLGHRAWRRLHYLAFPAWAAATFHGLGAGTDSTNGLVFLLYIGAMALVAALVAWRLTQPSTTPGAGGLAPSRRAGDNAVFPATPEVGHELE